MLSFFYKTCALIVLGLAVYGGYILFSEKYPGLISIDGDKGIITLGNNCSSNYISNVTIANTYVTPVIKAVESSVHVTSSRSQVRYSSVVEKHLYPEGSYCEIRMIIPAHTAIVFALPPCPPRWSVNMHCDEPPSVCQREDRYTGEVIPDLVYNKPDNYLCYRNMADWDIELIFMCQRR